MGSGRKGKRQGIFLGVVYFYPVQKTRVFADIHTACYSGFSLPQGGREDTVCTDKNLGNRLKSWADTNKFKMNLNPLLLKIGEGGLF